MILNPKDETDPLARVAMYQSPNAGDLLSANQRVALWLQIGASKHARYGRWTSGVGSKRPHRA